MSSPASGSRGEVLGFPQVFQTANQARLMALGTVQIMIGLMVFLFGIVSMITDENLSLLSLVGVFMWGAASYITAGSLAVAAAKSSSSCLVKVCSVFNAVAVVTAISATTISFLDALEEQPLFVNGTGLYMTREKGFAGVLAFFHLLETIASILVLVNASASQQETPYDIPTNTPLAAHAPPPYYTLPVSMAYPSPQVMVSPKPEGHINPGLSEPPAYSSLRSQRL